MPRGKQQLVVAKRSLPKLLGLLRHRATDVDDAIASGLIDRRKVAGQWLYLRSADLEVALAAVEEAANAAIRRWLLAGPPFLRYPLSKVLKKPVVSADAVEVLVRELIRRRRFGALGQLTKDYQPHLALFSLDDEEEVVRQLSAMRARLAAKRWLNRGHLPEPKFAREGQVWRSLILGHGEFLGLGRLNGASLIAWDYPDAL